MVEAVGQLAMIVGHLVGPVAIDRVKQERNRKPHPPEQRHRLVHPIAVAIVARQRRRRRQDEDGAARPRHYCCPSARKLRQSPQSVASKLAEPSSRPSSIATNVVGIWRCSVLLTFNFFEGRADLGGE